MINQRFLHNVKTLSNNILDRILEGNGDRSKIIAVLNDFYQHLYINGHTDRIVKVSTTSGRAEYATSNSAMQFRSGIEVKITNPDGIIEIEAREIVIFLLIAFPQLVRILISMGFDTWRGKLGDNPNTLDLRLEDYIHYQPPINITHQPPIRKPKTLPPAKPKPAPTQPVQNRKNTEFNGDLYGKLK